MTNHLRRVLATIVVGALVFLAAGCGGNQNTVAPASPQEHSISDLFWVMLGGATIGFALVVFLLWLGYARRATPGLPRHVGDRGATKLVVGLGIALPIALLVALFVWSDLFVLKSTAAPKRSSTSLAVNVIGHDWWWEVRYPGTQAVTANEIHVPVRTRVYMSVSTADVIHSFWIPELNRKIDMIPGQTGHIVLDADRPGVFRGQCSEFCGLQHAHMAISVVVQSKQAFQRWLAANAAPAKGGNASAFLAAGCGECHAIRGTSARGDVGPDLTHLELRSTLAALTLANTPANLDRWIREPQSVKPGSRMPDVRLSDAQWSAIDAYLRSLR
ncbi:MAG: cytochrome c oxidase subunit II [Gaiellaceae bacterium]